MSTAVSCRQKSVINDIEDCSLHDDLDVEIPTVAVSAAVDIFRT